MTHAISSAKPVRPAATPHYPTLVDMRAADGCVSSARAIAPSVRSPHASLVGRAAACREASAAVLCQDRRKYSHSVAAGTALSTSAER
jgi:hypothetical protein